jgi:hypothetical protein
MTGLRLLVIVSKPQCCFYSYRLSYSYTIVLSVIATRLSYSSVPLLEDFPTTAFQCYPS